MVFLGFEHPKYSDLVMIRSLFLTLIFVTSLVHKTKAQREVASQSIQWFALASNIKVSKQISIIGEGQFRYVNGFEPMQFQFRTGVDVLLNKYFSIIPLGYAYVWNPIYGKQPATFANNEHRIFEHLQFKHEAGRFNFNHRLQLEQRFIQAYENVNGETIYNGYDFFLNRLRYRLAVTIPFNQPGMEPGAFYASLYNEIFWDFGKSAIYKDPDQNRAFAGVGYKVNTMVSFQAGFLYQIFIKLSGTKQENNTGFQMQLTYDFDLTKKTVKPAK